MCTDAEDVSRVRLLRCAHGNFHLCIGPATLHLTEKGLALVGRAVNDMAERYPSLLVRMTPTVEDEKHSEEK